VRPDRDGGHQRQDAVGDAVDAHARAELAAAERQAAGRSGQRLERGLDALLLPRLDVIRRRSGRWPGARTSMACRPGGRRSVAGVAAASGGALSSSGRIDAHLARRPGDDAQRADTGSRASSTSTLRRARR
jgi:hypothetical protein